MNAAFRQPRKTLHHLLFPHGIDKIRRSIGRKDTVLDLGCGFNSPLQYCRHLHSLGVDIFEHYIDISRSRGIHSEYLKADISQVDFDHGSFDVVLCAQVIEHFSRADGLALLERMEPWARKKVIITTPNGYLAKDKRDGNEQQEHLSGWTPEDFTGRGYRVRGMSGLKAIRADRGATLFWRRAFDVTSKFTYFYPAIAFQLLAVKDLR